MPDAGSCSGWSCSTEGQYCPPNVVGSGGDGYCCKSGSWVAGKCLTAESCNGWSCSSWLTGQYCPPTKSGSSGDGYCCSSSTWTTSLSACVNCNAGQRWNTGSNGYCEDCGAGTYSSGGAITSCSACSAGKYSGGGATSCSACAAGTYSGAGASSCSACAAGEYSGGGASSCSACAAGTYSGAGASSCLACAAGTYSGAGASSCLACTAGKYSGEGQDTCTACAAGTYSTGGQAACTRCGGDGHYDQSFWDPNQSGLKSEDECDCAPGLTGTNCDQAECAATTALVSLGFLFLEVQWPRHARHLSRNEAFSGISAAFRAFDANGDDRLSVDEARAGAEVNTVIHRGGGHRSTLFPRRRGQG